MKRNVKKVIIKTNKQNKGIRWGLNIQNFQRFNPPFYLKKNRQLQR